MLENQSVLAKAHTVENPSTLAWGNAEAMLSAGGRRVLRRILPTTSPDQALLLSSCSTGTLSIRALAALLTLGPRP